MSDNISKASMVPGTSTYGRLDSGSSRINYLQDHHGFQHHTLARLGSMQQQFFPLTMDRIHDEEEAAGKGGKLPVWQRVKWTDPMVRLLITIVSYIGEDTASECGSGVRRKIANLQKKGKWKTVSKVMAERGICVSPQQCEDKLNDLTKRYKKLSDILGRGASCQVVENPALLNMMDHLSDKAKDEARKILSSKQLFYEEMCSYYNGNRLHLLPDPSLQRSLQSALGSKDELDEDEVHEEYEEKRYIGDSAKKTRLRVAQLEDQKLQIELEMMELEKQRFEWKKLSWKKARELEKPRMENERMRLENEQMALKLKQMEMSINTNQ